MTTIQPHTLTSSCIALLSIAACACGRQGDMVDQHKCETLEPSAAFEDGTSARDRLPGTVAATDTVGTVDRPLASEPLLAKGQKNYAIHCSPCHGHDGRGDGIVVRRGFPAPPSFHTERLRTVPDRYVFDVIGLGFGKMGSYEGRLDPRARWGVVERVRALQANRSDAEEIR